MSAAVQIRSVARIHETNLRKQGIVPLTFVEPTDCDHVEPDDHVSISGLPTRERGKPVPVEIQKRGGHAETIHTRRTITRKQIAWFGAEATLDAGPPRTPATGAPVALEDASPKTPNTKAKPGKDV